MIYELNILTTPVPKARPRHTATHTYTPQKTKDYERLIADEWAIRYGNLKPSEKPIEAFITFYMPIPKSKKKEVKTKQWHVKKPDIDNLAKAIMDSLNGLAYKDDSQIYSLTLLKTYSESPSIYLKIEESE